MNEYRILKRYFLNELLASTISRRSDILNCSWIPQLHSELAEIFTTPNPNIL